MQTAYLNLLYCESCGEQWLASDRGLASACPACGGVGVEFYSAYPVREATMAKQRTPGLDDMLAAIRDLEQPVTVHDLAAHFGIKASTHFRHKLDLLVASGDVQRIAVRTDNNRLAYGYLSPSR